MPSENFPAREAEALRSEIAPVIRSAGTISVVNQDTRDQAMSFLGQVKGAQKRVADFWKPIKDAAHKAWKQTTEGEATFLKPLAEAETIVKGRVLAFDREQEERRRAEERRLQAEADEKARRDRERALREAEKLKTPELREERIAMAEEIVAPVITLVPAVEKSEGESTRTTWKARLVDKAALIKAAAEGNQLAASLLCFDDKAANAQARASKNNIPVPGVEFYGEAGLAVRAKGAYND